MNFTGNLTSFVSLITDFDPQSRVIKEFSETQWIVIFRTWLLHRTFAEIRHVSGDKLADPARILLDEG
jgi:hypothetical protein